MHDIKRPLPLRSIEHLLQTFPCVCVIGARQVGKTTLLKQALPDASFFDLERQSDFQRISKDPDFFLSQFKEPIIIDEAQILPELFPALRVSTDEQRKTMGRFLISGSSSPDLLKNIHESLAGRMAIFELEGFSLEESWSSSPSAIYESLVKSDVEQILSLKPRIPVQYILESCLKGSYPEPFLRHRENPDDFARWMDGYFHGYIKRDVLGLFPDLNINVYQRFIHMLAGASGQILNASEFARSLDVSQPTVKKYFNIAHGTFIWRMVPSYEKNITKRIIKMPKGHMRDSGLLNNLLKNRTQDDLQNHPHFGKIWESFIVEELLKGFSNRLIKVEPYYYRTNNGAEIDLILEGSFGILPIEIKSGTTPPARSLMALEQFVKDHKLPYGIVINNARDICRLSKNILQIPAVYL